jgi:hypothetical protein
MKFLKIGIIGHRFISIDSKLTNGIGQALNLIDKIFPDVSWSVLSSLAEGTDQLVLDKVLQTRTIDHLSVPLPLEESDYLIDFISTQSRLDFHRLILLASEIIHPPKTVTREDAYWLAGKYILDHSDLIITLWDGQEAQGKGGTGDMIQLARQLGLPIIWIQCENYSHNNSNINTDKPEQGKIILERFPIDR